MSDANKSLLEFIAGALEVMKETDTKELELDWHQYGFEKSLVKMKAKR